MYIFIVTLKMSNLLMFWAAQNLYFKKQCVFNAILQSILIYMIAKDFVK